MKMPLLDKIDFPEDFRNFSIFELNDLAKETRDFVLDVVATKEGHLGASLGVAELTLALHYHYKTPEDLLVWDVGHQTYIHKLITGRKKDFDSLRAFGGMSGFPKRGESIYDTFGVGHSSTSISAIVGMAIADELNARQRNHIAVIGDASIVSGMAFEALNHLGDSNLDVLIVLNDNSIGIDPSVGALKSHFKALEKQESENNIFEAFGLHYHGIVDGHSFEALFEAFQTLDKIKGPKLLHVKTVKGKGYGKAEDDQVLWHSPGKFNVATGERLLNKNNTLSFQKVFGESLVQLAAQNQEIVAITPAMPTGSNLLPMMERFPKRTFDVGISEQHAVTLAAGLSTEGKLPFVVVYSTFLQRAYDQIIHDVALQNLKVIFCIDRAGIVGRDGATHHGVFDISYLNLIPNMTIAVPEDEIQLRNLMYSVQSYDCGPVAIRYPKGSGFYLEDLNQPFKQIEYGKGKEIQKGKSMAILYVGSVGYFIKQIIEEYFSKDQIALYNMIFVKPLDKNMLNKVFINFDSIMVFEEGTCIGGFASEVVRYSSECSYKGNIQSETLPDCFITHGKKTDLFESIGWKKNSLVEKIRKFQHK